MNPGGDITQLLLRAAHGDRRAEEALYPIVYREMRQLAAFLLKSERPEHTLQPTALVHEAYIRLTGDKSISWENRSHFFAVAARTMRHILIDHARKVNAGKRQGTKVSLESALNYSPAQAAELVELDEALNRLAEWDQRQSQVVELRFFGGLTEEETARVLGVSTRTVKREWSMARAWLYGELSNY
jgi:RNA polymerase sigma-70 factor, ECF subfamily